MSQNGFRSCFARVYDVCILGSGLAGLAAALQCARRGLDVLLIGPEADLAWEAGRGLQFHPGRCDHPLWQDIVSDLAGRGGASQDLLDPALLEVVATARLKRSGAKALYYANALALEKQGDLATGLILGTKAGLRRVQARRWIDATETGLLGRLAGVEFQPRRPSYRIAHVFFQQARWPQETRDLGQDHLHLQPTLWPSERDLQIRIDPEITWWRDAILPAVKEMYETFEDQADRIQISHASFRPINVYQGSTRPARPEGNLLCASPAATDGPVETLADRFELGLRAAGEIAGTPAARIDEVSDAPIPEIHPLEEVEVDVMIAGAGTGGALAAIAAGREFLNLPGHVLCCDLLNFPGGIGTGGGINGYYYGVPGGLQEEVDRRVLEYHETFGRFFEVRSQFHPLAKLLVLEEMIRQAGTRLVYDALLAHVETDEKGRVTSALVAGPSGPLRVRAASWVDATGDGDLCIQAGAPARTGRSEDGLLHTFSQSSGMIRPQEDLIVCRVVNFDADWCDPSDPEDLTRGRIVGICHYLQENYENFTRPTHLSPALGLRQGPQIQTDYLVTFDDTIRNADFPDSIGLAGSWYDNHSVDFEAESDEAVFWMWFARSLRTATGCRIPYRALLPKGLANVWIASRCLGVSPDAHYMLRMQRDMQRIGEAGAYAACHAARNGLSSREVPYQVLREKLESTDALRIAQDHEPWMFSSRLDPAVLRRKEGPEALALAMENLRNGVGGRSMWLLYVHRPRVEDEVRRLLRSDDDMVSWLAAGLLAMWQDSQAQPRLIRAIEQLEYGYDERTAAWMPSLRPNEEPEPLKLKKLAPNWLCAVILLRRCGDDDCLDALDALARRPTLSLNARVAVALTLTRLCRKGTVTRTEQAAAIADMLTQGRIELEVGPPQRLVGGAAQLSLEDQDDNLPHGQRNVPFDANVRHSFRWQLDLAVARLGQALGRDLRDYQPYLSDERLFVRRAFGQLLGADVAGA
jgi:hypothetical protein